MLLSENQAAFRKKYSTLDHIFSLYALNEIQKSKKLKLFCCFVESLLLLILCGELGFGANYYNQMSTERYSMLLSICIRTSSPVFP